MRIRTKHLLAFLSATVITFMVVGVSLWGFYTLQKTTDYLVLVNSKVLEEANSLDKELAHSRRAEKEFFIFPDNPEKQAKYIGSLKKSYQKMRQHLFQLERLFQGENNIAMLKMIERANEILTDNEVTFDVVVEKFTKSKSYDEVNKAEYGTFKERIHTLEDIAVKITQYGLSEVEKGRQSLEDTQKKTMLAIWVISIIAVLWGIFVPIIMSRRLTRTILYLTNISNDISKGKIDKKIQVTSKDELGELAGSIQRMQTSISIMLEKFKQGTA